MLGAGGATLNHWIGAPDHRMIAPIERWRAGVKDWWRKWSYEIPLAVGDALWEVLVVQFADFLSRLTLRRVLEFIAIVMLALAFAQTLPIDLAFLFAGDTLMYLEILIVLRLAAGRAHLNYALRLAAQLVRFTLRVVRAGVRQPVSRVNRLRERRTATRSAKRHVPDRSDDGWGFATPWGNLAAA
jgi:hypothetical protein